MKSERKSSHRLFFGHSVAAVCSLILPSLILLLPGCSPPAPSPPVPGPQPTPTPALSAGLQTLVDNMTAPIALVSPPDGTNRKFIVDQTGTIFIVDAAGNLRTTPFLDVSAKLVPLMPNYDERGLLALAFHPNYATNGRFFVKYNAPKGPAVPSDFDSELHISEFHVSADPNVADNTSEKILLIVPKPEFNHNGGNMHFGPTDGFLYIGLGDGGGANDVGVGHNPTIGNGQDKSVLLGKILRINIDNATDNTTPYAIPPDNPFVNVTGVRPEIWAYGLRNPYSFSFDNVTGRLFLGDEGQNLFEEIDIITKGGDFGWNIKEGFHCFSPATPDSPPATCPNVGPDGTPLTDPIIEYAHTDAMGNPFGIAVIGGFVYRGSVIPALAGQYIFGDLSKTFTSPDGSLFAATQMDNGTWTFQEVPISGQPNNRMGLFLKGIGQDAQGELYLLGSTIIGPSGTGGKVVKLVPGS